MSHFNANHLGDSRNTNPYIGCIVVQGQSKEEYITEIKRGWAGFQIIFSTWDDTDKSLYEPTDIVIYNPYPEDRGVANLGYQKLSTQKGFLKARELGWERAVKWRSDQWPKNGKEFYKLFDTTALNVYAWMNHNGGYICDYFVEGDIQSVIDLYEVPAHCQFPEKNLTQSLFEKGLNPNARCIVKGVNGECDMYSGKWEKWFGDFSDSDLYTADIPTEWNP
jgi:hypothetical protein